MYSYSYVWSHVKTEHGPGCGRARQGAGSRGAETLQPRGPHPQRGGRALLRPGQRGGRGRAALGSSGASDIPTVQQEEYYLVTK